MSAGRETDQIETEEVERDGRMDSRSVGRTDGRGRTKLLLV